MEDLIQTQNSVTRPISRLDSIMSELINENEESLPCQPLTNPYFSNSMIGPKNYVILKTKIQFQHTYLNLTKPQVLKVALTFWQVISFLKLTLNMNVIPNLMLVIPFQFLIQ